MTSYLYTATITTDGQRDFTLLRSLVDVGVDVDEPSFGLRCIDRRSSVTMNERLIMVWNTARLRIIDFTTEETADVSLPDNCSDGLRTVHLSGRSTRYRYEDYPYHQGPRVVLECGTSKESSIYVYVFTITPDEPTFTNQPLASLEPLPVPTGEVFKSLAFSNCLSARAGFLDQ